MPVLVRSQPYQLILHIDFVDAMGDPAPYNIWTGDGNLTFENRTYTNAEFSANEVDISTGQKGQRLTLSLPTVKTEDVQRYIERDPGPRNVEFSMIWRENFDDAWEQGFYVYWQIIRTVYTGWHINRRMRNLYRRCRRRD